MVRILILPVQTGPPDAVGESLRPLVNQSNLNEQNGHVRRESLSQRTRWRLTLTESRISSGCTPGNLSTRSMNVGSEMYCAAFSADLLNSPSNESRAHCSVCSIAFGKFFRVQIGMLFSGGSCVAPYDSVTNGTTTCGSAAVRNAFSEREPARRLPEHCPSCPAFPNR